MRRSVAIFVSCWLVNPALADWVPMSGAEINTTLTGAKLTYETAWQEFYVTGRTLYDAGHPSWGTWETRGDQYCSQWPPADGWACYDMERETETGNLRFIGDSGNITQGDLSQ